MAYNTQLDSFARLREKLQLHLSIIYPMGRPSIAENLIKAMRYSNHLKKTDNIENHWNESDVVMISYGNSITRKGQVPLQTLNQFLDQRLSEIISAVHILPFFPYSSDDGFSIINYLQVNEALGSWDDIKKIAAGYRLMSDLVVNHCSARSEWFQQFIKNKEPGKSYFYCAEPSDDLTAVVRPRTNPLLKLVNVAGGIRYVWCTFSHDQVDFNFRNPDVLIEFVKIIAFYLAHGVQILRLDAIAFVWKELGSSCLNLKETHEIVRLLRTLIDHSNFKAIIITETNIPNRENLSYFGNANEAHVIYNFALPPLLLHGMLTGNNRHLNNWLMSMPPAQDGTTYLNFIASHDGIGLRSVEGVLSDGELSELLEAMQKFGGKISWRNLNEGQVQPYEINISLFTAMQGTIDGKDRFQIPRFICAHAIMVALEGIPAFYVHSLTATQNDETGYRNTGSNRAINRHSWNADVLDQLIDDGSTDTSKVFGELKAMLNIRKQQLAFHPNATQYTLHLGEGLLAFWRQSRRRDQSIFCIYNITNKAIVFCLTSLNLIEIHEWTDLVSGIVYRDFTSNVTLQPYKYLWLTNS